MHEWRDYFRELLEGKEQLRMTEEQSKKERTTIEGQEEDNAVITEEEIEKQMKKLKKRKAVGKDGLENEVWI